MTRLLSVEEALALVLARAPEPIEPEGPVDLADAAGRTLLEDVLADGDFPAWPRSRVDGYAVRAAETPGTLDVVCEVAAGSAPGARVAAGQAARIFTGGAVPDGADAVVKQEEARAEGSRVEIFRRAEPLENVTLRGSECGAGTVVASRGTVITPAVTGVLASVGRASVRVARRPRVVVIPTGNELVPIEQTPPPGRIRNSNAPALVAAMASYGARATAMPIVTDVRAALDDALNTAFAEDPAIVLLTGGVSVGDYDLVPAALAAAGVERVLHGVSLQPGKPLWFGVRGKTLVFGLPGNPVSALVNAVLFVRPALRKMSGRTDLVPETLDATLEESVGGGTGRRRYVPARTRVDADGRLIATPVRYAGSGDVFGFSRADALVVVPEHAHDSGPGWRCKVLPLAETAR
jgi:molybdenum cofactor synthesis domain-containing protein